jgi:parallel beta-helix repeat protein
MKRKTILKYISLLIVTALFRRTTSKKEPILINYYPKNTTPVNFKLQEIVDNTLNTQANDIFNVLDYIPQNFHKGIKDGTNTTFLTSYIQAAIDAVHKSGGGTLFFPAGTYKVFTLKLSSYLTLDGHQATITSDASDTNPCLGVIQSEGWGSTATTYDAAVKNLTIDGGNANYAIFIHRSERVNVENCRINNVKKGGIRFNYETSNCTAVNNYIELPVDRPLGEEKITH